MEWSKIPMFDRFDAISHIMPYYALTHKAFLLLSSLSSTTRRKLDEFYLEFVEWMKDNWVTIYMNLNKMKEHKFLPLDLITVKYLYITENNISKFIEFIENFNKSVGCCFNNKYMHSRIHAKWRIRVDTILYKNKTTKSIYCITAFFI